MTEQEEFLIGDALIKATMKMYPVLLERNSTTIDKSGAQDLLNSMS